MGQGSLQCRVPVLMRNSDERSFPVTLVDRCSLSSKNRFFHYSLLASIANVSSMNSTTVLVTGTGQVDRVSKLLKQESSATMSLSDCDSAPPRRSFRTSKPSAEPIMEIIAREIASSLRKSALEDEEGLFSPDEHDEEIADDGSLHALASMVVAAVDKEALPENAEEELLSMLRRGLELGGSGTDKDEGTAYTVSETSSRSLSFVSRGNSSNNSGSTESNVSRLSNYRHNAGAPVSYDWNAELNFDDEQDDDQNEDPSRATEESSVATGDYKKQLKRSQSLHDFVKTFPDISSSDSDDEVSLLSEVSGLTGVFSDYPEGHRNEVEKESWCAPEPQEPVESAPSALTKKGKKKDRIVSFNVTFSDVDVRVYNRVMCEHPATSHGPSVGIDWTYEALGPRSLAEWESERGSKRSSRELQLKRRERELIIRDLGYSEREIATVIRNINKAKTQRRQTVNNLGAQKVEEMMEGARRKVKRLLFLSRDKSIRY